MVTKPYLKAIKFVYLYRHDTAIAFCINNNQGAWMSYDNLHSPPWENVTQQIVGTPLEAEFQKITEFCYCDFCACRRTQP